MQSLYYWVIWILQLLGKHKISFCCLEDLKEHLEFLISKKNWYNFIKKIISSFVDTCTDRSLWQKRTHKIICPFALHLHFRISHLPPHRQQTRSSGRMVWIDAVGIITLPSMVQPKFWGRRSCWWVSSSVIAFVITQKHHLMWPHIADEVGGKSVKSFSIQITIMSKLVKCVCSGVWTSSSQNLHKITLYNTKIDCS